MLQLNLDQTVIVVKYWIFGDSLVSPLWLLLCFYPNILGGGRDLWIVLCDSINAGSVVMTLQLYLQKDFVWTFCTHRQWEREKTLVASARAQVTWWNFHYLILFLFIHPPQRFWSVACVARERRSCGDGLRCPRWILRHNYSYQQRGYHRNWKGNFCIRWIWMDELMVILWMDSKMFASALLGSSAHTELWHHRGFARTACPSSNESDREL